MIAEGVICLILLVGGIATYSSGARQRSLGRAWRNARQAMITNDPNAAIEPLDSVLKIMPRRADVRLQLVGLLVEANRLQEAEDHLKVIVDDEDAVVSGDELAAVRVRAVALVEMGMLTALAATKEKDAKVRGDGFAAARAYFDRALALECPQGVEALSPVTGGAAGTAGAAGVTLVAAGDALAGLGLLALWEGDVDTAQKRLSQAVSPRCQLGRQVQPELFNGLGLVAAARGDMNGARARFRTAGIYSVSSDWKAPKTNLEILTKGMVGSAEMKPEDRQKLLRELESGMSKGAPRPADRLNLVGCGYFHLGETATAANYLREAVEKEPDTLRYQINLLAVRCDELTRVRAEHEALHAALFPDTGARAQGDFWRVPVGTRTGQGKPDEKRLQSYKAVSARFGNALLQFEKSSSAVLKNGVAEIPPELVRELVVARLDVLPAAAAILTAAKDSRERGEELTAALAEELRSALKVYPDDVRILRMHAKRQIDSGDYLGALETIRAGLKIKPDQPDAAAYARSFSINPVVLRFLPGVAPTASGGPVLARTPRPLVGFVSRVNTGPVALSSGKASLALDGRAMQGLLWGTEFLAMPDAQLKDGAHVLTAELEDALGRKVSASHEFLVDDSPPEVQKTEPADEGKITGPRPRLVAHYSDRYSGIDTSSVEVELRSEKGASTWLVDNPVRGGRHVHDYPAYGIKQGELVGADKVVVCPTRDLGPGPYRITVTVGDLRGMKTSKTWVFHVEK
jgi:tetratricopeptide (TPR) repeat protein